MERIVRIYKSLFWSFCIYIIRIIWFVSRFFDKRYKNLKKIYIIYIYLWKNKYILYLGMLINVMVGLWVVLIEFWVEYL